MTYKHTHALISIYVCMYVCMLEPNLSLCCEIRSMNLMQHVHFIKIKGSSNEFTVMGQRTRHAYDCLFVLHNQVADH